ncbi:hypothetical protein SAMN05421768_106308 [Chryseobacterium joostei]|uniref:DUF4274 domain-containing protein n=1 Tax=Chryseobacterium joostei TaxID=112234 RepID=A0A1N7IS15_9FLAO|nr:hypothetical protein [Chryseobacterium joostei]SIS39771.1 hypothetical protein SAMN05421768_106308 [Chryseobacterium joostei]
MGDENEIFQLIKTILNNFENGFYKKSDIHFDPSTHITDQQLQVPDFMKQPTNGEETYIYLEQSEVDSWFGEILENKIKRCDTSMELYNIASFVKYHLDGRDELILKHPLCDKGIAVMLFWRLKTFRNVWFETSVMAREIIDKVRTNQCPEILAYNPKKDKAIKMNEPKPKWNIPEIMTKAV